MYVALHVLKQWSRELARLIYGIVRWLKWCVLEPDSNGFIGKAWHLLLVLMLSNKKLQYALKTTKPRIFIAGRNEFLDQYGSSHFLPLAIWKVLRTLSCKVAIHFMNWWCFSDLNIGMRSRHSEARWLCCVHQSCQRKFMWSLQQQITSTDE